MATALRQDTLETIGLGHVMGIFKEKRLPGNAQHLASGVFEKTGKQSKIACVVSLVTSEASSGTGTAGESGSEGGRSADGGGNDGGGDDEGEPPNCGRFRSPTVDISFYFFCGRARKPDSPFWKFIKRLLEGVAIAIVSLVVGRLVLLILGF